MNKPFLLFRGPVESFSGYGSRSRDILKSLYDTGDFEIKIDSSPWGMTPLNALKENNLFHNWVKSNIIKTLSYQPDLYIQVTVPNEFLPIGKFNIGITAGIETTTAPKEWIDGCNKMDLILTSSNFSKEVLMSTLYNELDSKNNSLIKVHRIDKPIEVLFEGVDTNVYNKNKINKTKLSSYLDEINSNFCFLFVGHWLKGKLGEDRKDVGMLIKCFGKTFQNLSNPPALILKTSSATFSVRDRENLKNKIKELSKEFTNPPPIYLLFGELSDEEMNELYNHDKVKTMVSLTKGEGFGRPLLEFSMSGKPIIASNWSGHKDFLPMDKSILVGGELREVDESATDKFIIKGSKWFTADYDNFNTAMKFVIENYDEVLIKSDLLRFENKENFNLDKTTILLQNIIRHHTPIKKVNYKELNLPELIKIK